MYSRTSNTIIEVIIYSDRWWLRLAIALCWSKIGPVMSAVRVTSAADQRRTLQRHL